MNTVVNTEVKKKKRKYVKRFTIPEVIYQNPDENSKERFIDYYYDNELTRLNIRRMFYLTNFYLESKLKKDVYEFTVYEIDQLLWAFHATTEGSLAVRVSHLKNYVDFCIRQNIKSNPINFFDYIVDLDKYVMKNSDKYKFITRERLYNIIDKYIVNPQIAVIFILAFEGVIGKAKREMLNLKKEDVDTENNIIAVQGYDEVNPKTGEIIHKPTRKIHIHPKSMDIIENAMIQKIWFSVSENDNGEKYDLAESDYVLKYVLAKREINEEDMNVPLMNSSLSNRIHSAQKYFPDNLELIRKLSVTTLEQSGMLEKLEQIELEQGEITIADYSELMRIYNKGEFSYHNIKRIWDSLKKRESKINEG